MMHAARNIQLCNKDCVCLFICPTGATNTETGQIDFDKCLDGCRLCVDACPSGAIYLVPSTYPKPQPKSDDVVQALKALARSKSEQEEVAKAILRESDDPALRQIATAALTSCRIVAEDLWRESGYIIAQSDATRSLLKAMVGEHGSVQGFPMQEVQELLTLLEE
jgi:Fe-S-cluster-containing hydrogenase component 2